MELTLNITVSERLEEVAKALLKAYADLKGAEMSDLCGKSIGEIDWLKAAEPKIIRDEIKNIVQFVKDIAEQATIFVCFLPRIFDILNPLNSLSKF